MNQDVFGVLKEKLTDLACGYLLELGSDELNACFSRLARFPLDVALGALDAAPIAFPTAFPTTDELVDLCERIAADNSHMASSTEPPSALDDCEHQFQFELEPEGGLYLGFDVCVHCGRATPRVNKGGPPVQLAYFRMTVNPQETEGA